MAYLAAHLCTTSIVDIVFYVYMRSPHRTSIFQDRTYQALLTIVFDMSGALTEVALKKIFNIIILTSNVVNTYANSMIDDGQ